MTASTSTKRATCRTTAYRLDLILRRPHDLEQPEPKTFPAFDGVVADRFFNGKNQMLYNIVDDAGQVWLRRRDEVHALDEAANDN